tara:strand:- start:434 stop:919 length:486 start_codon:yes stop_codon:yes gene_type:complete
MKNIKLILLFTFMISGAINAQSKASKFEDLKALIESKNYRFVGNWAYPMRGGNINLIGNPNSLTVSKDSVDIFLPFFGVSRLSHYNTSGGFEYEGAIEDYKVEYDDNKQKVTITFNVHPNIERLDVTITASSQDAANIDVISSHRDIMRYKGDLKKPAKNQ